MNDTKKTTWKPLGPSGRDQGNIVGWSLAWVAPFLATGLAIENNWIEGEILMVAAIAGVTVLGLGVLLAYRRFLKTADELVRKIHLDALAITVGVGVVAGFSYTLLERAELVDKAEVTTLITVMVVTYIAGVVAGLRRYS